MYQIQNQLTFGQSMTITFYSSNDFCSKNQQKFCSFQSLAFQISMCSKKATCQWKDKRGWLTGSWLVQRRGGAPLSSLMAATGPEGTAWSWATGESGWMLGKGSAPQGGQELVKWRLKHILKTMNLQKENLRAPPILCHFFSCCLRTLKWCFIV